MVGAMQEGAERAVGRRRQAGGLAREHAADAQDAGTRQPRRERQQSLRSSTIGVVR
jgi:hypothetical protein